MKPQVQWPNNSAIELGEDGGAFRLRSVHDGGRLMVVASNGLGWDHVSVSRKDRTPNYAEMEYVRSLFFEDSETVMQLSVARDKHVNRHPNCLHWWRPQESAIPTPPLIFV